jgi:DNA (cytosine-5)-methyltransferase 1
MSQRDILEKVYKEASKLNAADISNLVKKDIDILLANIEGNKSLVSAMAASLLKKIIVPKQDIRLHRTDFLNGYSARSLDTHIISPFFKDNFPKYANKESAFLTLAIREKIKWTKREGKNLKIRNVKLREAFLNIFDQIETFKQDPQKYLLYLFFSLIKLSKKDKELFKVIPLQNVKYSECLNIDIILEMLAKHFNVAKASRLPVIAIYSIYEILFKKFDRYKYKKLMPLQAHTSSDKHSLGDIEIYTRANKPFEIVEIKHNIAIDEYLIFDAIKKIGKFKINRYYILTTFQNSFKNAASRKKVLDMICEIKKNQDIDIITNGVLTTIKYYLRFVDSYIDFLDCYTKNLVKDAKLSTEVRNFHLQTWHEIMTKCRAES